MRCDSMLQFVLHFFFFAPDLFDRWGGILRRGNRGERNAFCFLLLSFLLAINRDRKFISSEREGVRNREFTYYTLERMIFFLFFIRVLSNEGVWKETWEKNDNLQRRVGRRRFFLFYLFERMCLNLLPLLLPNFIHNFLHRMGGPYVTKKES